jgi:hypothetical protein
MEQITDEAVESFCPADYPVIRPKRCVTPLSGFITFGDVILL